MIHQYMEHLVLSVGRMLIWDGNSVKWVDTVQIFSVLVLLYGSAVWSYTVGCQGQLNDTVLDNESSQKKRSLQKRCALHDHCVVQAV
jgi:hypothetical protein